MQKTHLQMNFKHMVGAKVNFSLSSWLALAVHRHAMYLYSPVLTAPPAVPKHSRKKSPRNSMCYASKERNPPEKALGTSVLGSIKVLGGSCDSKATIGGRRFDLPKLLLA